jgi:diaminopimelate decarboxylase
MISSNAVFFSPERLVSLHEVATPCFVYDLNIFRETLNRLNAVTRVRNFHVHYAFKANTDLQILNVVREAGLGADCVSGQEVKCAITNGFRANQIAFAGVGKTDGEIRYALEQDIFCFNAESMPELQVIAELAAAAGRKARIALRLNPNVKANTHHYITTGLEENKFGIGLHELSEVVEFVTTHPYLELLGIHVHIGSQITDMEVFRTLCMRVNELQEWFASRRIVLKVINVGGGLGVNYHEPDREAFPNLESYFEIFSQHLHVRTNQEVHFELGRSLVAQCGALLSRVTYIKQGVQTQFAILDAGMTELIRPALYQAYHKIENLSAAANASTQRYDVVGPVCESSDCFGKAVDLPETKRGDLLAIRTTGAYGEVMASNYNLRERAPTVYFN